MSEYAFLEFLSSNRLTNYPFKENIVLPNEIPQDFIVDIVFSTDIPSPIFISRIDFTPPIGNTAGNAKIYFNGIEMFDVCLTNNEDITPCDEVYSFDSPTAKVKMVIGNANLGNVIPGQFNYTDTETRLEESVVVPYPKKVTSLNDLIGDVKIKEGYNVQITNTDNCYQIAAIPGAGLGRTPCEEKEEDLAIRTINNESKGTNFIIKNTDCIEIINYPSLHMLAIHNRCDPCCSTGDCEAAITLLEDILDILETNLAAVETKIETNHP